jgi:putative molybdopterin biosynthesis protein
MPNEMMTAKEVATYLNLNTKKVYQLVNDGLIPAARVGGKLIFPRTLLEEWLYNAARKNLKKDTDAHDKILVAIGSNDLVWELLSRELIKTPYHLITPYASVGSIEGLLALSQRIAHLAGIHLLDPLTNEYNISYLSRYLGGFEVTVVNLFYRMQGIIIRKGNPKRIHDLSDFARNDVVIINRQEGSGTRILFDTLLQNNGISPGSIKGYEKSVTTHMELAAEIGKGHADTGLGIQAAAQAVGLDFIPIKDERYDIVLLNDYLHLRSVQALLEIIRSDRFKTLLNGLEGYNFRDTGKTIFQGAVDTLDSPGPVRK